MKKSKFLTAVFSAALLISAASSLTASDFRGQSLNGTTGLIATPTAHTGWDKSERGIDIGIHYISEDDGYRIPKVTLQLIKNLEIGAAYDMQPQDDSDDLILHGKFKFSATDTHLAIGGNYQKLKLHDESFTNQQAYLAATYRGSFIGMPAETTIVFGKTFGDNTEDSDLDFSMGFDVNFLPKVFNGYIHWISDFANYSYSRIPGGADYSYRGCLNTGFRLAVLKGSKFKLNVDVFLLDALEDNRSFASGISFGMPL